MEPLSANDPQTVGEFSLRARLGAGGMGQVYLGFSPAGRAVAIKVVHKQLASDPEFRRRFGREAAAARAVSGMYTAPVVAVGLDDDPPWFATAYVPGPSLAEVVAEYGPLPEAAAWRLAAGLAEALRAVHAAGLVHRDLKPANVLLAADGPHVIDFGISRAFEGTTLASTGLTATGMVVGTPGYMSPEQAEGQQAGPASDVFSLGSVLAYAVTGNAPFGGGSAPSVLYRVVTAEPELAAVAAPLRQVIESCLRKNPMERTGLAELSAIISARGPAVPAALGSFWPKPLNAIITASRAYQDSATQGHAATSQAGAPRGAGRPGQAGQVVPPPGPVPSGYQPTATALGGTRAGQPGMVPDGYLAAATGEASAAQAASWRQPGNPAAPGQSASSWPQATPAAPGPSAARSETRATYGPQATLAAAWPQPEGGQTWAAGNAPGAPRAPGTPAPLAQYTPAPRRRPAQAEVPSAVLAAARLMYAGAVASLLGLIFGVAIAARDNRFAGAHPLSLAGRQARAWAGDLTLTVVLGGIVGIACWLAIAAACRRGRGWTRPVATALLGLDAVGLLTDLFATRGDLAVKAISLVIWAIGLAAVILLWSQQAGRFLAWRRR